MASPAAVRSSRKRFMAADCNGWERNEQRRPRLRLALVRQRHCYTGQWAKVGINKNPIINAAIPKPAHGSAVPFGPTKASTNDVKSKVTAQGIKPTTNSTSASVAGPWGGRGQQAEIANSIGAMTVYALNGNSTNRNHSCPPFGIIFMRPRSSPSIGRHIGGLELRHGASVFPGLSLVNRKLCRGGA